MSGQRPMKIQRFTVRCMQSILIIIFNGKTWNASKKKMNAKFTMFSHPWCSFFCVRGISFGRASFLDEVRVMYITPNVYANIWHFTNLIWAMYRKKCLSNIDFIWANKTQPFGHLQPSMKIETFSIQFCLQKFSIAHDTNDNPSSSTSATV